jgi:hypothetical protein
MKPDLSKGQHPLVDFSSEHIGIDLVDLTLRWRAASVVLRLATAVHLPVHHQYVILPLSSNMKARPHLLAAGVAIATGYRGIKKYF